MKFLLALALATSTSAFAYTPDFEVSRDTHNTITLTISNEDTVAATCKFTISYLENILSYRKHFGKVVIAAGDIGVVTVDNNPYSNITNVKATVDCK